MNPVPPSSPFTVRTPALLGLVAALCFHPCHADTPVVAAARIERGELSRDISFDAELRPFQEVELHAKVTGYMETLKVDAGDSVQEGQVIASIEVPELKIEIEHAQASERRSRAEIARARAAYDEVHLGYTRITATDKAQPHLIAAQDIDAAKARDQSAEASIEAAKEQANVAEADVRKLQAELVYSNITAPFTGVITKRYADRGALIQAGTSAGAMPVVRLSQNDKLRAVFPVTMSFVSRIKVGDPVDIRIDSVERTLHGKVARFSRKVETSTRTMDAEVDVPNEDLSLIPGLYATAILTADHRSGVLLAPIAAVVREKEGGSVYVITKDHKIEERKTTLGVETPSMIEILGGVSENEMLFIGSRAQVKPGEVVEPKLIEAVKPAVEGKAMHTAKAS
ncbi:MAG: Efflux transporter, family, subunit [Verrucomicrobiaceae bacterium]|nr:Efflux transporter, family, subunit [Verrucomicrobiaceae bacterium]